jgi:DNA-directed RNA polymerase subunit E'/Rpb7
MFVLMILRDTVRLSPHLYKRPFDEALIDELQKKYANKVIPGHGLGIAVDGFESKGTPTIYANDGGAHIRVEFRLIVFRPFRGEHIVGRVRQQDASGLIRTFARGDWHSLARVDGLLTVLRVCFFVVSVCSVDGVLRFDICAARRHYHAQRIVRALQLSTPSPAASLVAAAPDPSSLSRSLSLAVQF